MTNFCQFLTFHQRTTAEQFGVSSMTPNTMARELREQNKEVIVAGWGARGGTQNRRQQAEDNKNKLVSDI